jgi:hypothetical protein
MSGIRVLYDDGDDDDDDDDVLMMMFLRTFYNSFNFFPTTVHQNYLTSSPSRNISQTTETASAQAQKIPPRAPLK